MKKFIYHLIWLSKQLIRRYREKGFFSSWNFLIFDMLYNWRYRPWINFLTHLAPLPQCVEIEISTSCNLRCKMCELTYWDEPAKLMSLQEFKYIVEQFPKLRFIAMTGIGENFLNPDFLDMYRYLKRRFPYIYIELYDTFYFIDKKKAHILIEEIKIDKVQISFDAVNKNTYETLRKGANFERVLNNIKDFIEIKKQRGLLYPEIRFHFVVNRLNISEILDYIDLVASFKDKDISIQFTRMLHYFPQVRDLFIEVPPSLLEEVERKSKALKIPIIWNADIPLKKPPVYYCANWMMPFIFITGEVIPCCAMNEANVRHLQRQHTLGNVFKENLKKIWKNKKYKELRQDIRTGKIPSFCFNCPMFINSDL